MKGVCPFVILKVADHVPPIHGHILFVRWEPKNVQLASGALKTTQRLVTALDGCSANGSRSRMPRNKTRVSFLESGALPEIQHQKTGGERDAHSRAFVEVVHTQEFDDDKQPRHAWQDIMHIVGRMSQ